MGGELTVELSMHLPGGDTVRELLAHARAAAGHRIDESTVLSAASTATETSLPLSPPPPERPSCTSSTWPGPQDVTEDAWGSIEVGASVAGYAFTGREWDPETGLYYYRARYYDPKQGRFISEDPIGFAAGMNFFSYVDNGPIHRRDPSGHNWLNWLNWLLDDTIIADGRCRNSGQAPVRRAIPRSTDAARGCRHIRGTA